jgi:hypothetical protein
VTPPAICHLKRKFGVIPERQRFGGDELDELALCRRATDDRFDE